LPNAKKKEAAMDGGMTIRADLDCGVSILVDDGNVSITYDGLTVDLVGFSDEDLRCVSEAFGVMLGQASRQATMIARARERAARDAE